MLWRDGRLGNLQHFARRRNARIGVLSSGLDVLILFRGLFYFIYVLLSFWGIPECVAEVCRPFAVEVFWEIPVEACLYGLEI